MLTNLQFYGKINELFIISTQGKIRITITKEIGNIVHNGNTPHYKQSLVSSEKQKRMTNLNINLEQATNYLIQLFYQTNVKYSCTRTKIGKMLSIVAFKYACEEKLAFNETIYKYDSCGTAIKDVMLRFKDPDIYPTYLNADDQKKVRVKFNKKAPIPQSFSEIDQLSDDTKKTIESVFLSFAAFSPKKLGECLNPIVNLEGIADNDGRINVSKVGKIKLSDFNAEENGNPVLKFLFK